MKRQHAAPDFQADDPVVVVRTEKTEAEEEPTMTVRDNFEDASNVRCTRARDASGGTTSNTTCPAQVFFKRYKYRSHFVMLLYATDTHKQHEGQGVPPH